MCYFDFCAFLPPQDVAAQIFGTQIFGCGDSHEWPERDKLTARAVIRWSWRSSKPGSAQILGTQISRYNIVMLALSTLSVSVSGPESTPPLLRAPAQAALRPSHAQPARRDRCKGCHFFILFIFRRISIDVAGHWRRRRTTNKERIDSNRREAERDAGHWRRVGQPGKDEGGVGHEGKALEGNREADATEEAGRGRPCLTIL